MAQIATEPCKTDLKSTMGWQKGLADLFCQCPARLSTGEFPGSSPDCGRRSLRCPRVHRATTEPGIRQGWQLPPEFPSPFATSLSLIFLSSCQRIPGSIGFSHLRIAGGTALDKKPFNWVQIIPQTKNQRLRIRELSWKGDWDLSVPCQVLCSFPF